jgi:hypothetical protein
MAIVAPTLRDGLAAFSLRFDVTGRCHNWHKEIAGDNSTICAAQCVSTFEMITAGDPSLAVAINGRSARLPGDFRRRGDLEC